MKPTACVLEPSGTWTESGLAPAGLARGGVRWLASPAFSSSHCHQMRSVSGPGADELSLSSDYFGSLPVRLNMLRSLQWLPGTTL